ncbi:MAG: D-glycerate dehydrogenase [Pseudomonadota bacterium]
MSSPRIIATRKLPDAVEARLRQRFTVALNTDDVPFSSARLMQALEQADGLICTVTDLFDEKILAAGGHRRAKIIANFGVGVDHIDLDAAEDQGLAITNTPGVLTDATADLAMALLLATTRRVTESEAYLRRGDWKSFSTTGFLGMGLQGKTLGIVGMGRIGEATARRAHFGFGMKISYFSRSPKGPFDFEAQIHSRIEDLLADADVVSLHMPGGGANAGLISKDLISKMKTGAYLINTARGDLVDEQALAEALSDGRLSGAGLDVFADEPNVPEALLALSNVTLLPHIGSATVETRTAMGMLAVDNLEAYFEGRPLPSRVV